MAFARPLFAACLGLAIASTAQASSRTPYANDPMEKHMGNALMQPLRDINLKKDKIPPRLLQIQDDPYNIQDMSGCRAIVTEIVSLRPMLGPDVNEVQLQSDEELRAVRTDGRTVDKARIVRDQENHTARDFFRLAQTTGRNTRDD